MNATVKFQRVGGEGQGVGYDDAGNIYFVPGALPGDVAVVAYEPSAKRYRDAEMVEILSPSSEREIPSCAYFQQCGGCDWLHWAYPAQLRAKEAMLAHILVRSGLLAEKISPMVPAEHTLGYRNRIQIRREGGKVGFYRKRSHSLVDIERCEVADSRLNTALTGIRSETGKDGKIELAVGDNGEIWRWEDLPHGIGGFSQLNPEQNERLRAIVASQVQAACAKRVIELYAGNGNLTFAYLSSVEQAIAVESSARAMTRARETVPAELSDRVSFLEDFVSSRLRAKLRDFRADTLILDPPRSGTGGVLAEVVHPTVQTIIYVSCAPLQFARDVRSLGKEFRIAEIVPIDMFPHTRHIELVARLERVIK